MSFRHSFRLKPVKEWKIKFSASTSRPLSTAPGQLDRQKPYFITTPIFYPNSDPHVGHVYSTVVADVIARYSRLKSPFRPVVFVTGTDEHGAKIQEAACKNGFEGREQEFCDKISARFRDLVNASGLSHTRFIRTTDPKHTAAVQHLWARDFIYKGRHKGWYSISDECFYTDSQVESVTHPGTHKKYVISKETKNIVELSEEENYKFRLSHFRTQLLQRYHTEQSAIMPRNQFEAVLGLLDCQENVADISISRPSTRLKWGIPVPNDPNHTIYVWVDALTAYLTSVGYPWTDGISGGFSRGWPPDIQVIGKDILRFHAIYFPAFLLALGLPLPKTILSHAHLTVEKAKMSKSLGNTADPFTILEGYGADVVRFYLARIGGRYKHDKDWSENQLRKHKRELFSALGNLLARAFSSQIVDLLPETEQYVSIKPEIFVRMAARGDRAYSTLETVVGRYTNHMDKLEISHALQRVVECLEMANREYTTIAPWLKTTSVADISRLLSYTRETLRICGILLQPFLPTKAAALLDSICVPINRRTLSDATIGRGELSGDMQLAVKPTKLFSKVGSDEEKVQNE